MNINLGYFVTVQANDICLIHVASLLKQHTCKNYTHIFPIHFKHTHLSFIFTSIILTYLSKQYTA